MQVIPASHSCKSFLQVSPDVASILSSQKNILDSGIYLFKDNNSTFNPPSSHAHTTCWGNYNMPIYQLYVRFLPLWPVHLPPVDDLHSSRRKVANDENGKSCDYILFSEQIHQKL